MWHKASSLIFHQQTNISKGDSDIPSMDLFKAVFKNSDSEDSSSESEQDQSETQPEPVAMEVSSSEGNAEMDIGDGKLPGLLKALCGGGASYFISLYGSWVSWAISVPDDFVNKLV